MKLVEGREDKDSSEGMETEVWGGWLSKWRLKWQRGGGTMIYMGEWRLKREGCQYAPSPLQILAQAPHGVLRKRRNCARKINI